MNFKKHISLFILLIFLSCTQEDKYPETPIFSPHIKGDFVFEEIKPIPEYYKDADDFIFFRKYNQTPPKEVLIYNKKNRKLTKRISYPNTITIDYKGVVYSIEGKKVFSYNPPNFEKKEVTIISLNYVNNDNLKKLFSSEIEKIKDNEVHYFLQRKRHEILKRDIIDSLTCITKLWGKPHTVIARFKNTNICLTESHFLQKKISVIELNIDGVEDCKFSDNDLDTTNYFGKNHLKLFDEITTNFRNGGSSNHFVPGITIDKLYYYELSLNGKSIKFKTKYEIDNLVNFENKIIIRANGKYYKVSIKSN